MATFPLVWTVRTLLKWKSNYKADVFRNFIVSFCGDARCIDLIEAKILTSQKINRPKN